MTVVLHMLFWSNREPGSSFGTIQTSLEVALLSLLIYLSGLSCTLNKIKILDSHINCHIGLICYLINGTLSIIFFSVIYKVLRNRLVLIFVFLFKIIINN